jgi:hypothetical protein
MTVSYAVVASETQCREIGCGEDVAPRDVLQA